VTERGSLIATFEPGPNGKKITSAGNTTAGHGDILARFDDAVIPISSRYGTRTNDAESIVSGSGSQIPRLARGRRASLGMT